MKDDVVTFSAHLSVTIQRLSRYKQKGVLAAMLEGKRMYSNMAANTNDTTLCHKIFPLHAFPLKFRVRYYLWALTIFGISNISSHCLKEPLVT